MIKFKDHPFTKHVTVRNILTLFIAFGCMYVGYLTADGRSISGEEGVVLDCIRFEFWRLLKPFDFFVHGCTVDHMPLYHLVVKAVFSIFGYEVFPIRFFSILVSSATVIFLFRWLAHSKDVVTITLALVASYAYLSSGFYIKHLAFMRMYSLYALLSLLSLIIFVDYLRKRTTTLFYALCFINLIGFFNYALHGLLVAFQLPYLLKIREDDIQKRTLNVFLLIFGSYGLVKFYYVFSWRIVQRSKELGVSFSLENILNDFFFHWFGEQTVNISFILYSIIVVIILASWILRYIQKRDQIDQFFLFLLFGTLLIGFFLRYGLSLREVSYRYFIYLGFIPFYFLRTIKVNYQKFFLIILFVGLGVNRSIEGKIHQWQASSYVLSSLVEFTQKNVASLNSHEVYSDAPNYYSFYVKSIHDFEFHLPINKAKYIYTIKKLKNKSGWYILFFSDWPKYLDPSFKSEEYILESYQFYSPFDERKKVFVLRLELPDSRIE